MATWPVNLLEFGAAGFGLRINSRILTNDVNVVTVDVNPGMVFGVYAANTSATAVFIKVFDSLAANVIVGTTTPIQRYMIPPVASGPLVFPIQNGKVYATGCCYVVTTGIADSDTAPPAASTYIVEMYYK